MPKKKLELEVVGMNHRVTLSTLAKLASDVPLHCRLEREPDNAHDENAVKVIVIEKPWAKKHDGMHIGYIARAVASVIAPAMDEGGSAWPYTDAWLTAVDDEAGHGELILSQENGKG